MTARQRCPCRKGGDVARGVDLHNRGHCVPSKQPVGPRTCKALRTQLGALAVDEPLDPFREPTAQTFDVVVAIDMVYDTLDASPEVLVRLLTSAHRHCLPFDVANPRDCCFVQQGIAELPWLGTAVATHEVSQPVSAQRCCVRRSNVPL